MRNILINGVSLNDPNGRWHIGRATGFRSPASRTHTALVQPGRDGEFPLPRENFGVAKFGIEMIIYDTNELGVENQGPAQTQINSIALQAAFAGEFEMIEVLRARLGGTPTAQRAYGIVAEGFSYQIAPNIKTARVTVPVTISDGSWEQLDTSFQTGIAASTTRQVVTLDPLTGTDAPTTNAVIRIGTKAAGTINIMGLDYDPRTRAMVERTGISYTGTIASGRNVYIDVDKFTAWESSTSGNWDNQSASTDVSNGLNYPGDGKLVNYPTINPTVGAVETIATNYFTNPSVETNTSSLTGSSVTISRSTDWSITGGTSLELVPNTTNNDSFAQRTGSTAIPFGLVAGNTYKLIGTVRTTAPLIGPLNSRALSIMVILVMPSGTGDITLVSGEGGDPSRPGVTPVSMEFTIPMNAVGVSFRFYHGGRQGTGSVWWDGIGIFNVGYNGTYFDGDTFPRNLATAGYGVPYHIWGGGGTPHNNPSLKVRQVAPTIPTAQIAIQTTAGSADVALRLKGRYR